jgi:tRNA pseudouridine38-40 synthase
MRRLALLLEYDGRPYAGSQLQANGPSIQGELERAIEQMTSRFSRVAFAGRTDAGVHALGQVAAFDTDAPYRCEEFEGGLNTRLPDSIAVRAAREVDSGFDPRRHALSRRYRYTIVNSATRAPLEREQAWRVAAPLAVETMQNAAARLVGEHDFAAFASPEQSRLGTRRMMHEVCIVRRGRRLEVEMTANAFLMHQVRRSVAALVDVGSGHVSLAEFTRHLCEARPGSWQHTAPARGLCLDCVVYQPAVFARQQEQQ